MNIQQDRSLEENPNNVVFAYQFFSMNGPMHFHVYPSSGDVQSIYKVLGSG